MDVKHILLVALLVSATSAGPLGQRNSKCSTVCDETQKFFYEIGKEYEYKYEAETRIAITDTLSDEATVRVSALAIIQPVTKCEFTFMLKDVILHGSEKSDIFSSEVSRRPMRFAMQNGKVEHICGSDDEATWVINFKKGILSNIQNSMTDLEENEVLTETDVSGICETSYSTEFKDSEIVVTKTKIPSECEHKPKAHQSFSSFDYSFDSLVQGLPLLKSSQTCTQHISDEIIKKVYCEESHTFSPFEMKSQGSQASSKVTFELSSVRPKSSTYFSYFTTKKNLLFDHSDEDKEKSSLDKTEEILSKLNLLTQNGIKKEVPALFSELVTSLRGLSQLQIQSIYQRCEKQLKTFIVDALPLVGTAESMGAIVDLILKGEITEKEKNIWFTSLGLVSNPSIEMFSAVEPLLESSERTNALLGISSMIYNYCEKHEFCENERIIEKILRNFESRLGVACRSTTEEEKLEIIYSLKAIGNVGRFINSESSLKRCYLEENPMEVRVAAIDTWRRAPCSYDRDHLLSAYTNQELDNEIRISAYLGLMKCPTKEIIDTVKDRLTSEGVNQVASFVWSHLTNLQESAAFEKQWIRELIGDDLLQKKFSSGSTKMSKYFESSFYLKEQKFGASIDSNVIFSDKSFLPKSSMVNLTVELFGQSVNLFELGGRIEGFEAYIEKFFGPNGYYPEETLAAIIKNLRKDGNQQGNELFTKDTDEPRGSYYLKLFGNEILYRHFEGIESLLPEKSFTSIFDLIINLLSKGSVDFTKSYNLVNAEFTYPTIIGFPLRLKVDGKATIDMKLDGTFNFEGFNSINIDGKLRPSAAIMFDSSMTIDAFVSKSGMKMLSTAHSSTIIDGKALVKEGKLIDFTINVPDEKTEIFDMSNEFYKIENDVETKENTPGELYKNCYPLINSRVGLEICYEKFLPNDESRFYTLFKTFKKTLFLKKTDTHSAYIIRYTHTPEQTTLLFDMPDSKENKKYSISLSHIDNKYELDVQSRDEKYNGKFSYVYGKDAKGFDLELNINDIKLWKSKFYFEREVTDTHKQATIEVNVENIKELININGKSYYDVASKSINGKLNIKGTFIPKINLNFDLNRGKDEDSVNFEIVSDPFELSMSGKVGSLSIKEGLLSLKGKYRLHGSPVKALTTQVEYTNIEKPDGRTFTCSLNIDEFGLNNYIYVDMTGDNFDSKIKGRILDKTWNIENSYTFEKTDTLYEMSEKHVSEIPSIGWKYSLKTHVLMSPKKFLLEKETTYKGFEMESKINWNYGKNFLLYYTTTFGGSRTFKVEIDKVSSNSYKLTVFDNLLRRGIETNLVSSLDTKLESQSAEGALKGVLTIVEDQETTASDFAWTYTVNESELKSEIIFNYEDLNRFFIIEATKNSVLINSNIGKQFNAEGKIEMKNNEKSFLITSNLEGQIFEAYGSLKDKSIEGALKYNDQEAKILARLNEKGAEFELQLSPTQRFAFLFNYNFGIENILEITLETPFKNFEKQDARFSLTSDPAVQGQLSITWQNTHHIGLTFELEEDYSYSKSDLSGSLRFSSTLEGFERFELNLKHSRDSRRINTKLNGKWNSEIISGNLDAYLVEDGCKLLFDLKTPILKDILVSFDHKLTGQDLSTSLDFSYGTEKTRLLLKGSMIDLKNMTGSFICQSSFLPAINVTSSIQIGNTSTTIEINGNYNKQKLLFHCSCENYNEDQDKVCKMSVKFTTSDYKIIDGSYSQRVKLDKFESDIELSSYFLSNQSIKGHVEGRISSPLSGILIGYISGPNFTGRININHEVSDGKISSEGSVEFNDFKINIGIGGKIDVMSKEGFINLHMESSWQPINDVKVLIEHEKKDTMRETHITLSKNERSFKIYHIFSYKDSMNWSNYLKVNDIFSLKNEMEFENSIMKHVSSTSWMGKTIRFKLQNTFGEKLNIVALLDTPWTSYLQLTLSHYQEGSRKFSTINFEYGDGEKLLIDSSYEFGPTLKFIKISASNPSWNLKSFEAEVTSKTEGANKAFDISVQLNKNLSMAYHMTKRDTLITGSLTFNLDKINPLSLLCKYSFNTFDKEIYIEFENLSKFSQEIKISGNRNSGTISSITYSSSLFKEPIKNMVSYRLSGYLKQIVLDTVYEGKTFQLDASLYPNKFELISHCPHGEGNLIFNWQFDELKKEFSVDFVSPFKFIKSGSVNVLFDTNPNYHIGIKLVYDIHRIVFDGKFNYETIEAKANTTFSEWQALSMLVELKNKEITGIFSRNSDIIKVNGIGSFKNNEGEADFILQLPFSGYEDNSMSLKYTKNKSDYELYFSTNIGGQDLKAEFQLSPQSGILIDLQTPWEKIEKIYLQAIMDKTSVKINGLFNEQKFESVLKATKNGYKNFTVMFSMTSTIPNWTRFSVESNILLGKNPYNISLKVKHQENETEYSAMLDISKDNVRFRLSTPIEIIKNIEVKGSYDYQNKKLETTLALKLNEENFKFSGYIDDNSIIPNINIDILTPYEQYKNIKFILGGSLEDEKSVNFLLMLGESISKLSVHVNLTKTSGSAYLSLSFPVFDIEDTHIQLSYDLESETKYILLENKRGYLDERYYIEGRITASEINIAIESPFENYRRLLVNGKYQREIDETLIFGKIINGEEIYRFEGKLIQGENGYKLESSVPLPGYDLLAVNGEISKDKIVLIFKRGFNELKFSVSYTLKPNNAFVKISTPFEDFSFFAIGGEYNIDNDSVSGKIFYDRNKNHIGMSGFAQVSPKKSNIKLTMDLNKDKSYLFNVFYDILSKKKEAGFEYENNEEKIKYSAEGMFGNLNHGFIKFYSSLPGYEVNGFEYKLKTKVLSETEAFITLIKNSKEYSAGIISKYDNNEVKLKFLTPFENYEEFGVEGKLIPSSKEGKIKIMIGNYILSAEASLNINNFYICIETPFKYIEIFKIVSNYEFSSPSKQMGIEFVYNKIKYLINGKIDTSFSTPSFFVKLSSPFKQLNEFELSGKLNANNSKDLLELKFRLNDVKYLAAFGYEYENYKGLVLADFVTPFEGWTTLKLQGNFDLQKEGKIFEFSIETEGKSKPIYFSGKVLDGAVDFDIQTPFEAMDNFKTKGSFSRSKRSVEFMMMNDHHSAGIAASFNSLKIKATTPFQKAADIEFEISKNNKGGWFVNYHRNGNKVFFKFSAEPKKKGISITIESEVPGWEFLALSGRLDAEEIIAYIDGEIDSGTIHLSGSGVFGDRSGSLTVTSHSSFEKYKEVITKFEYNVKRSLFTFDSRSSSSDYKILIEYKRGLFVDIFVPNDEEDTVAKGKLTIFNGSLDVTSRFPRIRTFSLEYSTVLSAKITSEIEIELNGVKLFELEFERDSKENKAHLQIHGRRGENHSMLHFHREGFNKIEFTFNRNGKEFKVTVDGSGDLPTSGSISFTISNSFRLDPRTITGRIDLDRTSSPKTIHIEVTNHLGKLYVFDITYDASLSNVRKGEFHLSGTLPDENLNYLRDVSGNWEFDNNNEGKAVLKVNQKEYTATGRIGIHESDLVFESSERDQKYYAQWKIYKSGNSRDYFLKLGPENTYFMLKLKGTYDKFNGDVSGAFRFARIMKNDFIFTDQWTRTEDGLTGSGTFELGEYSGTHTLTNFKRDPVERSATFHWEAHSNIPKFNSVVLDGSYSLAKRYADVKLTWDTDELSVKFSLDNLTLLKSENTIRFHGPLFGDSEITLSHDFSKPLEGHIKAVGNLGSKQVSILASWSANKEFTKINFHLERDLPIGQATLHIEFDTEDVNNAKGSVRYKLGEKFVDIDLSRVKTKSNLVDEINFKSNITPFESARVYVNADWSKGFKLDSGIVWGEKSVQALVDIGPKNATASITTPFPQFGDININADYDLKKPKAKSVVLRYERGDKVVDMNFSLKTPSKKSGSLDFSLSTPFEILQTLTLNASWKKGNFNAVYKRNDLTYNIDGKAEIKTDLSSFALKFTLPSGKVFEIEFSADLDEFLQGTGEAPADILNIKFNINEDNFLYSVKGYRTPERLYIEIDQNTSFGPVKTFHLKLDSELNLSSREGVFEVTADEFHFSVKNTFERKPKGFYARSQFHSTLTNLPGLTVGFGRDGDSFIFTTGWGDEREISFTFKGKDHFRKGFYGTIDIPRRGIHGLEYSVTYNFKSDDKLQVNVKVQIDEGKTIDAEILYNSDGVKARLTSPWTGIHSARARRSISNDYFMADIGVDNYGITIESDARGTSFKKGLMIEGEIFGKKYMIYGFTNLDSLSNSEGKFIVETPYKNFKGSFKTKLIDQRYYGEIDLNLFYTLFAKIDVDFPNKIKGEAALKLGNFEYAAQLDFNGNSDGTMEGKITINTPHDLFEEIVVDGSIKALSIHYFQGFFRTEFLRNTYSLNLNFKQDSNLYNLDALLKNGSDKEYKIQSEYSVTKAPFTLKGKSSVQVNGDKVYSSTNDISVKGYDDIKLRFEVMMDIFEGTFYFDVNENEINSEINSITKEANKIGLIMRISKPFKEVEIKSYLKGDQLHSLDFKFTQEITSKTFSLNIDSPTMFNIKISLDKKLTENTLDLDLSIKENKFILNVASKNGGFYVPRYYLISNLKMIIPYFDFSLDIHIKDQKGIVEAVANLKTYDNLHKAIVRIETKLDIMEVGINIHSSLIPGNEVSIRYAYLYKPTGKKFTLEGKVLESLHSISVDFERNGITLSSVSPYIPTGMATLIGNIKNDSPDDLYFKLQFTDAHKTLSSEGNIKLNLEKEAKVDLALRTPFEHYEKLEFGIKYIADDIKYITVYAKPFGVEGETHFGMKSNKFLAGLSVKTNIENYEITEAEAIIPLNEFDPKISAHIGGIDYALEGKLVHKPYGKEIYYSSKNLFDLSRFGLSYRSKSPYDLSYEFEYKNYLNKFGLMFDSSILALSFPMIF